MNDDDPPLDPDYLSDPNHYGEHGPVQAVWGFFGAVARGSYLWAWAWMDSNLQTCRAQAWLWNNREVLESEGIGHYADLLVELQRGPTATRLWREFSTSEQRQLETEWNHWLGLHERDALGAASHTRVGGYPGTELILLAETVPGIPTVYNEPTEIPVLDVLVRHVDDNWRIAAYGNTPPTPGWPPDFAV